ncbi:MAG: radical SAM family heme chaperone HemW [Bacillota bacterium]|nr:radical SAM family heme chaperone HemW [Bacillota bacterium]
MNPYAAVAPRALYLHLAFCRRRCRYCSFLSRVMTQSERDDYVNALCCEIRALGRRDPAPLATVYFGGGTPGLLTPGDVGRILETVEAAFGLLPGAEITLEVNPGGETAGKLKGFASAGVTRLSVGLQAAQDSHLAYAGRGHSVADYVRVCEAAGRAGFASISSDILYGLPRQTPEEVAATVRLALELGSSHLSFYSLSIDPGTVFERLEQAGKLDPLPDEDTEREMYAVCLELAEAAGLGHYELSNAARPGHEGRHNLVYWHAEPYQAAGAGASSYTGGVRRRTSSEIGRWMEHWLGPGADLDTDLFEEEEAVSRLDAMREFFWLGLRLTEGVSPARFEEVFGAGLPAGLRQTAVDLVAEGLLEGTESGGWRLTRVALDIANVVFRRFLLTEFDIH